MNNLNIIFHCPFPLDLNAKSASGIRPIKILQAFRDLGCNVDLVTGYSRERRLAINEIKRKIKNGHQYSFVYSESSTMPTALTDPHHLPLNPFLDFNFFKFLKNNNIKIGLFYRDIHWKFDHYGKGLPWYKKQLALFFYYFDLKKYNEYIDIFYLPSWQMAKYINFIDQDKINVLPPAHDFYSYSCNTFLSAPLKLLYVGGIGEGYKLHYLFQVLNLIDNIQLTVCTRENDWLKVKEEYGEFSKNIQIVHENSKGLDILYEQADICVLFVEPKDYWEFAVPFKLYEYIGRNKPILCCSNTLVGDFVYNNNIGWAIDYNLEALTLFLKGVTYSEIQEKMINVQKISKNETWVARVKKVLADFQVVSSIA
ncbi:hypothetical protein [Acinetobacter pittii]|uniref:hypothetical protein n=1 Tax=Acinetobacter pittii TaxID=48296 RepID=UPI00301CA73E